MHYTVTNRSSYLIEISNDQGEHIGALEYTGRWVPDKARITTRDHNIYDIAPSGFWQTTRKMIKNGMPYAELKPTYSNGIELFFETGETLSFKKKSFWSSGSYIVTDSEGREIAAITSTLRWKTFNYHYEIETHATLANSETNTVLPFIMVYCSRYLRMRSS